MSVYLIEQRVFMVEFYLKYNESPMEAVKAFKRRYGSHHTLTAATILW